MIQYTNTHVSTLALGTEILCLKTNGYFWLAMSGEYATRHKKFGPLYNSAVKAFYRIHNGCIIGRSRGLQPVYRGLVKSSRTVKYFRNLNALYHNIINDVIYKITESAPYQLAWRTSLHTPLHISVDCRLVLQQLFFSSFTEDLDIFNNFQSV